MYSLESPHRGDSNEYTTYHYFVEDRKHFHKYRHLFPDLAPWLNLIVSNYPSLEQISMVPKMFEPLKFDFTLNFRTSMIRGLVNPIFMVVMVGLSRNMQKLRLIRLCECAGWSESTLGTHAILNETALVAQFDARPTGEHSLPSADSRRAVVSCCRKNMRNTG